MADHKDVAGGLALLFGKPKKGGDSSSGGADEDFKTLCRTVFDKSSDEDSRIDALYEAICSVVEKHEGPPKSSEGDDTEGSYEDDDSDEDSPF